MPLKYPIGITAITAAIYYYLAYARHHAKSATYMQSSQTHEIVIINEEASQSTTQSGFEPSSV